MRWFTDLIDRFTQRAVRQAAAARPHRVAQLVEAALAEAGAARMGA